MTNFLISWHIFDFMTNLWHIYDVMTNLLMRWQTFWRDDVLLTSWRTFCNDEPFVLMTYFDIITNILKSGQTDFLKSWWVQDIITNLWRHNKHNVSNILNFLLSWRISWPAYIVLTFFISSFWAQNILKTCFWRHWHYDILFILW